MKQKRNKKETKKKQKRKKNNCNCAYTKNGLEIFSTYHYYKGTI